MAINKITAPAATPAAVADYQAQNNLIAALALAVQGAQRVVGSNIAKGAIFYVGGSIYMADADTPISGTASDYVKLTVGASALTPSYVANLTGVSWSSTYNGYYDVSGNLYVFDELKALSLGTITTAKLHDVGLKNLAAGWATALITALGSGWLTALAGTFLSNFNYITGTIPLFEQASTYSSQDTTYINGFPGEYRQFMKRGGQVTVEFTIKTSNSSYPAWGVIYKNGTVYGGESSTTSTVGEKFSFTVDVAAGDYIQIFRKVTAGGAASSTVTSFFVRVGNVI